MHFSEFEKQVYLWLVLTVLGSFIPVLAEEIKLEGNRTIHCENIDGVRYVAFQELLTVLDLDQEYSDETGRHTVLSSDRRDGVSITFVVGNRKISINREEIFIPYPPTLVEQKIMLPADIILTALGALRVVPTGSSGSELSEVTFSPFLDFTRTSVHFFQHLLKPSPGEERITKYSLPFSIQASERKALIFL